MILQSLASLYEDLAEQGKLERPGWLKARVSWAVELDDNGTMLRLLPLVQEIVRGKKTLVVPQDLPVPAPVKRTVGIVANFLCDNSSYVFGIDSKKNPERAIQCFECFRERHHELLDHVDHPAAVALLRFLDSWKPQSAADHPLLLDCLDDVVQGANIVFMHNDRYLHDIPELKDVWQDAYESSGDSVMMRCLVTGRTAPVALLHPSIKGVMGAQSSGAALVSFNASAFESYGRNDAQGLNAPVSKQAAFAYGAALNYLIGSEEHRLRMGDMTVVHWTEGGEDAFSACFNTLFGSNTLDDNTLKDAMRSVAKGQAAVWKDVPLHPDNRFYILGLAPNAARLSVRFFLSDTAGKLLQNVMQHQADLEIVKPAYDTKNEMSLWWLLQETVNQNSRDKTPHPQMTGDLARAIFLKLPYPATLFEQVQVRIRAEREVTRGRAAIIKAYLLRQPNFSHKEVLTVQLNSETNYPPYVLGRLFSVLEALQEEANRGINATIRDKYFSSACSTPAIVFPTLLRLAQAHLKKLDTGKRIYFDKQICELTSRMDASYPVRLSLQDQGVFQLGYYHQVQKRYTKKEDVNNG